jgi:propionate CoA-transferase
MLSLPAHTAPHPLRLWKTISTLEAVALIEDGATIAVEYISDGLADSLARAFGARRRPRELTIVYASTRSLSRSQGLNRLAEPGLVRRVIGGQWYPVPALHRLAMAGRIEAYSLPAGIIQNMMRATADGLPAFVTRSGLGSLADPRRGGGRLNETSREAIVHLTEPPMPEMLMFPAMPLDFGMVDVGFRAETGALVMSRDAATLAEAVHRRGGLVIGQSSRPGTITRLRRGQIEASESLVDFLVVDTGEPERPFGLRALA